MARKKVASFLGVHKQDLIELSRAIFWAVLLALLFRSFFYQPFKIPSGSMLPNLHVGDYLFASKFPYGYGKYSFPLDIPLSGRKLGFANPVPGDVIVFKGEKDPENFYIKRLIGKPGDVIQMKKGRLFINGSEIRRSKKGTYTRVGPYGEKTIYTKYVEMLPTGKSYIILDANLNNHDDFPDQTIKYKVPSGHYFFMGDNRNNSIDSRFLNDMGFIPEENLVGRADFIFWSKDFSFVDFFSNFDTGRAFRVLSDEF